MDVGSDQIWTGALTGAAYRLTNAVDVGAVRYYYRTSLPGEPGLLFDFDPSDGTYLDSAPPAARSRWS